MKRSLNIFIFLVLLSLSLNLVSAATSPIDLLVDGSKQIFEKALQPLAKYTIGGESDVDVFARALFFLILFGIVFTILQRVEFFSDNGWVLWIISIAVPILATRFLTESGVVQTILLPYSVFGIVVTAGLPFVLFFFIVMGFPPLGRRLAWLFFAIVFIGLYFMRYDALGDLAWIYFITAVVALIMLPMDKTFQKWRNQLRLDRSRSHGLTRMIDSISDEIRLADERLANGVLTPAQHQARIKDARRRLANLRA